MAMIYRARYVPKDGCTSCAADSTSNSGGSSDNSNSGNNPENPVTPPPTPKTLYKVYGVSKESETPPTKEDLQYLTELGDTSLITLGTDQLGVFGYWAVAVPTSLFTGKKIYLDNHELVGGYKTEEITLDGLPYTLIADQDREELSVINLSIR